jgi:hypothetical protein
MTTAKDSELMQAGSVEEIPKPAVVVYDVAEKS